MKLKPEQLATHLLRSLAPVYVLSGDEPLLVQEAADAICVAARTQDYSERTVLFVETGFDWNALTQAAASLSLFSERRLLELRMPGGKPGDAGSKALQAYAARPAEDTVLLVICGKLEAAARNSKWHQALEQAGAAVQVWPVDVRALPAWIGQRMQQKGLRPSRDAVALLAERIEGNLLAAAQEIDKLLLLHGPGPLDVDAVTAAVSDSARFDVFILVDAALEGGAARVVRILDGLREEGVEPVLLVWALARELRQLAAIAAQLAEGGSLGAALARQKVWDKRKPLIERAVKRHALARWQELLRHCGRIDRMVKGMAPGGVWDELVQLTLAMAGQDIISTRPDNRNNF